MTTIPVEDVMVLLRAGNPVQDAEATVEPAMRTEALERVLSSPISTPWRRHPVLHGGVVARRIAVVASVTAAATATLLVVGEQRSTPQRFAVLPAFAHELSGRGILHVLERRVQLGPDGEPRGAVHEEEAWTSLDDAMVSRFRIGTGPHAEQEAFNHSESRSYRAETNTIEVAPVVLRGDASESSAVELPVEQMARDAASGKLPIVARPIVNGRPTLQIENDLGTWYIAQDAPELVRHEWQIHSGLRYRSDFLAFEVLDPTPANRELLELQVPPETREVRVAPRRLPGRTSRPPVKP